MIWTREMNIDVMRCFYRATQLDTNASGYRFHLRQLFLAAYPDLTNVTEQRLVDQKRVIINNKKLTVQEIEEIKREVAHELHMSSTPIEADIIFTPSSVDEFSRHARDGVASPRAYQIHRLVDSADSVPSFEDTMELETREKIRFFIDKWRGSNPNLRPAIPKLWMNRMCKDRIKIINNKIINELISEEADLEEIHLVVYACACTVTVLNGQKLRSQGEQCPKRRRKPAWQLRLEKKIERLQKEIG